jgi:hypothetical protein
LRSASSSAKEKSKSRLDVCQERQVWRYTHEGFLTVKEPLRKFRIFEHGLQEIFFVANKIQNVVVITPAGGHSFYKETQRLLSDSDLARTAEVTDRTIRCLVSKPTKIVETWNVRETDNLIRDLAEYVKARHGAL